MENEKSIDQLIKEQEQTGKKFLVPSYQRGYRWQKVNVSDLLNDLCEFIHSDKTVYSLQPLVVYSSGDNTYHVVDGQQRLTTITILLGFLGITQIEIDYEPQKVTFSDSLKYVTILIFNELYAHDFHKNSLNTPN